MDKANILYDHYKDTFLIQKENEKNRNTLFLPLCFCFKVESKLYTWLNSSIHKVLILSCNRIKDSLVNTSDLPTCFSILFLFLAVKLKFLRKTFF